MKDGIKEAQGNLRSAIEAEDLEQVREKINELQQAVMKIGEAINKGAAGGGDEQPAAEEEEPKKEEESGEEKK